VRQALSAARVGEADASAVAPAVAKEAVESALRLAKRKRIGPFALAQADRPLRQKQLATMIRAGHGFALARAIVDSAPREGDDLDSFTDLMHCSEDE
jgi:regulatory protein